LRLDVEAADALDRIAEELDACRCFGGCGVQIDDAAANGVFANRAHDVGALVSQ
jgi:hypothetical protein